MLRLNRILGEMSDPEMADRLHDISHHGRVEVIRLSRHDMARRRLQATTDHGVEVALVLDRDSSLRNGAVMWLEPNRAIIVQLDEPDWLSIGTQDAAAALELGYFAGNMHWKVRFDGACLHILLDGPREAYLQRLAPMMGRFALQVMDAPSSIPSHHSATHDH